MSSFVWCIFTTLFLLCDRRGIDAFSSAPLPATGRPDQTIRSSVWAARVRPFHVHRDDEGRLLSRSAFINTMLVSTLSVSSPLHSKAAMFSKDRRQLELCLVAVWRVVYWAESLAADLKNPNLSIEARKDRYLEARLAGKAVLTGKIGGGANYMVYTLSTLQLPGCLQDLSEAYDQSQSFGEMCRELYEAIASLVEFDGMDTLTDASPRSSLTLSQFDSRKETYVRRILAERVVPLGNKIIQSFPPENVARSQRYIEQNYANEIFPRVVVTSTD